MDEIYKVLREDFAAVKGAFDEGDFAQMNICSNRIMANALFGDQSAYALPGFFLKELATELLKGSVSPGLDKKIRPFAKKFISEIEEAFTPDVDFQRLWGCYSSYIQKTRKLSISAVEKKSYTDNPTFTHQALSRLVQEVFSGEVLFHERGVILKSIIIEADRLIRNHSIQDRDLVLICLFQALDRLNDYFRFACTSTGGGTVYSECMKSYLTPFMERFKNWYDNPEDSPYPSGSDLLCEIILEWRRMFIRYQELGQATEKQGQRIELPPEAKKRIGDTIAEALQKDLGQKGGRNKGGR